MSHSSSWRLFIKVISLVVAIGLWYYVNDLNTHSKRILLPIEIIPYDTSLLYTAKNLKDQKLMIFLDGNVNDLAKVNYASQHLKAYVDLKDANVEQKRYPIVLRDNLFTRKINTRVHMRFDKDFLVIPFEHVHKKTVPIELELTNRDKLSYIIQKIDYNPKSVTIQGPKRYLQTIKSMKIQNYSIRKSKQTIHTEVSLTKLPKPIELVNPDEKIRLSVFWNPKIDEITFKDIPIFFIADLFSNLTLSGQNEKLMLDYVRYVGDKNKVKRYSDKKLVSYLKMNEKWNKKGVYTFNVHLKELPGLKILDYSPKKISLELSEKNQLE